MKATLIVIETETDHAQAKSLIVRPMVSRDPQDSSRLAVQAGLSSIMSGTIGRDARHLPPQFFRLS
jgi:hypothetical protein